MSLPRRSFGKVYLEPLLPPSFLVLEQNLFYSLFFIEDLVSRRQFLQQQTMTPFSHAALNLLGMSLNPLAEGSLVPGMEVIQFPDS